MAASATAIGTPATDLKGAGPKQEAPISRELRIGVADEVSRGVDEVCASLGTGPNGLTSAIAAARLSAVGPNRVEVSTTSRASARIRGV